LTTTASPAAPAQTTPTTISATKDAATRGDFQAFERAELATREGKPLADVSVSAPAAAPVKPRSEAPATVKPGAPAAAEPAAPAAETTPDNRRTREEKEQARINEAIRSGISAETAALKSEIARLQGRLDERGGGKPADAPKPGEPAWKRFHAMPDAPKLEDFDSVAEHTAAMSYFIAEKLQAEQAAAGREDSARAAAATAQEARFDAFQGRVTEAKTADPEWSTKLSPEVRALKPFGALAPGETRGPDNFLAELIVDSEIAPAILLHFSGDGLIESFLAMPERIARIADTRARVAAHRDHLQRAFAQLEGRLLASTAATPGASAPAEAAPSPVTRAPAPADTITRARSQSDPRQAALDKGDFAAFDAIEQQRQRERWASR
jgi:hypothetical protein